MTRAQVYTVLAHTLPAWDTDFLAISHHSGRVIPRGPASKGPMARPLGVVRRREREPFAFIVGFTPAVPQSRGQWL